jgi:septal ring factor EnvC (AmiA/AmiB activator)
MAQLTEHDLQMLADYKTRQAQLQQKNAELQAQKTRQDAYWQNKRERKPKLLTTEVEHTCTGCNEVIPKKSQALPKSHFHTDTFPPYFTTDYFCPKCAVNMEAPKA